MLRRLTFESLSPADLDEKVKTVFAALEPQDLPQEPLAYCAYDLVVLFGPEFRALKKPHLEALTTWVRAGAVCTSNRPACWSRITLTSCAG